MVDRSDIERIAKLIAGDGPGWQTRFGTMTLLSRSHVSNLLSGTRPVTQVVAVKVLEAAKAQAHSLRARAEQLDAVLGMLIPAPGELLLPMTDEPRNDAVETVEE